MLLKSHALGSCELLAIGRASVVQRMCTLKAELSVTADRLQSKETASAQVLADRVPSAVACFGVLSMLPPPSPPPSPPAQRAGWVGSVRYSELSPADTELHDDLTAVVMHVLRDIARSERAR